MRVWKSANKGRGQKSQESGKTNKIHFCMMKNLRELFIVFFAIRIEAMRKDDRFDAGFRCVLQSGRILFVADNQRHLRVNFSTFASMRSGCEDGSHALKLKHQFVHSFFTTESQRTQRLRIIFIFSLVISVTPW